MVNLWFRKSREDLQAAKLLLAQESEELYGPLVFHAQQSAEKSIKGYLAFHKVRFSKTHNIEILVNLLATVDKALSDKLRPVQILTLYAVAYRYPDESEPPEPLTQKNCDKITKLAETAFKLLADTLGEEQTKP